jgi:hypothetical protein
MLIILRIVLGYLLLYFIRLAWNSAGSLTGDVSSAGYLGLCVIIAMANAVVWAPYVGDKLSDPLTSVVTESTYVERTNFLLKLCRWCDDRGLRYLASRLAFLEGIHHPDRPTAFIIGLKNARPGSWLEKVYALEVFRFDNAQNSMHAWHVLKRHGLKPGLHPNPEVNLLLVSLDRSVKPDPAILVVPPAPPPPPLRRNSRIQLFSNSESPAAGDNTGDLTGETDQTAAPSAEWRQSAESQPEAQPTKAPAPVPSLNAWNRLRAFFRANT